MGRPVFANGMEISSKSMGGKSICCFPDVCFTPPQTPATPPGVPIPYPNTGMASDCTSGSGTVSINGKEVMLKNKSYFSQSTGDEAGCAPKKGVITSKIKGKVYFAAWSMDVKVEGENVVRHLDLTTHNHGSNTNTATWPHIASQALAGFGDDCKDEKKAIDDNCSKDGSDQCPGALGVAPDQQKQYVGSLQGKSGQSPSAKTSEAMAHHALRPGEKSGARTPVAARMASRDAENKCVEAMRCFLRPKSPTSTQVGCCPGQTPNHIPPVSYFEGIRGFGDNEERYNKALCVCLEGTNQHVGTHRDNHALIDHFAETHKLKGPRGGDRGTLATQASPKLSEAITVSSKATAAQTNCSQKCVEAQLTKHYEEEQKLPPATTDVTYKRIAGQDAIDAAAKSVKPGRSKR
jgi:hypothetical protein